jgi:alpha,alpha-trehalase
MRIAPFLIAVLISSSSMAQTTIPPNVLYGELFKDVQLGRIFPDGKTFVDCTPKRPPADIVRDYRAIRNNPNIRFSLKLFVEENFFIPETPVSDYVTGGSDLEQHIEQLWTVLRRKSDTVSAFSSLLPLPNDYVIPGGRFREVYYWDTYFTMLGLRNSGHPELIRSMIDNFAHLINRHGHMPNGNRNYYLSRSQPPFFALMLRDAVADSAGSIRLSDFLAPLLKEYDYWMDKGGRTKHVVKMPDGSLLNRYWDQLAIPRQESYWEDLHLLEGLSAEQKTQRYRDLRSGAESGWDFSSRWFANDRDRRTIQTTSIVPVDLNCLLYELEQTISLAWKEKGNAAKAASFRALANKRAAAIRKWCWSESLGWYVDYNLASGRRSAKPDLAGMFPLFVKIASAKQAEVAKGMLEKNFLRGGGLVTTLLNTGEQWDAPNGWAPLQWIGIVGLENYGYSDLARETATRWVALNKRVFLATGKLMEKYDVVDADKPGGGGEYPSQDGFGWTNGVLLALIHKYNLH